MWFDAAGHAQDHPLVMVCPTLHLVYNKHTASCHPCLGCSHPNSDTCRETLSLVWNPLGWSQGCQRSSHSSVWCPTHPPLPSQAENHPGLFFICICPPCVSKAPSLQHQAAVSPRVKDKNYITPICSTELLSWSSTATGGQACSRAQSLQENMDYMVLSPFCCFGSTTLQVFKAQSSETG